MPATASAWSSAANFRWWTGTTWSSNSSLATSVIPGAAPLGGGVAVADYSAFTANTKKFVLVEQAGFGDASFKVFTATSPTGPWTAGPAATPPDACNGGSFGCYAVQGHPELSNSSQLVYSWYSVDDRDGYGHIRLGAVDW